MKPRKHLRTYFSLLLCIVLLYQQPHAQTEETSSDRIDKAQIHQALLDLASAWTVMCVAAHPDDEDGSTLTILRRKYGVHTVSLFSTFGEGGQNAVGPELYEQLGVIRARETMAAAEVQGSEPHFLGFRDFGFSKSAEETFRAWGEKELLRRMVLQIRLLRPDVIITNHDTTSGHGHHQATGRTVLQAFDAAADPKQFPEQLSQAGVWQVQRLFVRSRGQADATTQQPAQFVTLDPNETDPVRGVSYAQQALEGLHKHATQGPWPKTVPAGGARPIRYSLVRQAPSAPPLPANAKTPLDGLTLPAAFAEKLTPPTIENKPLTEYLDRRLELLVSLLNARRRGVFTASKEVVDIDPQRFSLMSSRLDKAIAAVSGASVGLTSESDALVPGEEAQLNAVVANSGMAEIQIKQLKFRGAGMDTKLNAADKILPGTETSAEVKVATPKTLSLTVPSAEHLYDGRLFGEPLTVEAQLMIEGVSFTISNETERAVAPAIEIVDVAPVPYVITPATSQKPLEFNVKLKNHLPEDFRGLLRVIGPNLETGREVNVRANSSDTENLVVRSPLVLGAPNQAPEVAITVDLPNPKEPIAKRTVPLVYAEALVVGGRKVGYLPSYDQTLERSLAALGVDATKLTVDDIAKANLSAYQTIIIDNRGYEAHQELIGLNNRLLKFAEDGGTLLVFYHRTGEWNPDEKRGRPQLAPYPIIIDDNRVTEEDAPVIFLQPKHPLLNFPNRITQKDFLHWVQERGLYFPKEWDQHYAAILSSNDKGEPPLRGGLLVAPYGRGNYIYTSYVWYRQLRAGLPGGYRMFANLISYGRRREN
ncbi:MAG TPA: PIG-L family deacetylase [Pyrinomonadaceae bacterium]|jgi:LmbE family N-acetylglucosaminyl deacetylase|nr:PIG-L family deacetylase [Pyrinomonadaceae bacterium]